jgi:D-3-phosphoglycerate dehydrogenase / 2-oxoglutarate reductase
LAEKILVALSWANRIAAAPEAIEGLRAKGWEIVHNQSKLNMGEAELIEALPGVSAVIAGSDRFTAKVFESADSLKSVARVGVGFDAIDLEAATKHGVVVTTSPVQELFEAMADHTFGLMIGISRKIPAADRNLKAGEWDRMNLLGPHLFRQTLGIVGLGRIGREVARLGRAFKMRLLCHDVIKDEAFANETGLTYVELPELLRESDYISVHTPLTPVTRNLINRERLSAMKPTAYLVNTSRGPVVDEEALHWALTSGVIAGAASDVFHKEPVEPDSPLVKLDNFIATPHVGGLSIQAMDAMFAAAAQAVADVLEGRKPFLVVNPDVYQVK